MIPMTDERLEELRTQSICPRLGCSEMVEAVDEIKRLRSRVQALEQSSDAAQTVLGAHILAEKEAPNPSKYFIRVMSGSRDILARGRQ